MFRNKSDINGTSKSIEPIVLKTSKTLTQWGGMYVKKSKLKYNYKKKSPHCTVFKITKC